MEINKAEIASAAAASSSNTTASGTLRSAPVELMGAEILGRSRIPLFQLAAELAQAHHERWDGTGYPAGLAAETIPLSGRIVAVVDFFDALTMDRCYRKAFPYEQALEMLAEQRGHAFDPNIVDTFLANAQALISLRERINHKQPTFAELTNLD